MAQPYIVRPKLTENDVISEIRTGTDVRVSVLMDKSGLSRAVVRRLVAEHAPKNPIKLPARTNLNPIPAAPPALRPPALAPTQPKPIQKSAQKSAVRRLIAGGCFLTAVAFAAGNAFMNVRFGASFGQGDSDRMVLGLVGLAVDCGSLFLFAAAGYFWEDRRYELWLLAMLIWGLCVGLSAGSALGYTSNNVGDTLKGRGSDIEHQIALTEQKKRAETYRKAITETGDQKILENQMNIALGAVPRKNRDSSKECTEPTISAVYCYDYNRFKDAYVSAKARDDLDKQIASLTGQLAALPPVSAKDPGAEQISQMASGAVTAEQVRSYLVRCLALIISMSPGPLLAFARALLR